MENNSVLFRFIEYDCRTFDEDRYNSNRYITGIRIEESYDRFLKLLKGMKGHTIRLCGKNYKIDDYAMEYGGEKEDLFCVNVFCYESYE